MTRMNQGKNNRYGSGFFQKRRLCDSRVGIEEYIEILKKKGFQGMVITDHDTYNGYR